MLGLCISYKNGNNSTERNVIIEYKGHNFIHIIDIACGGDQNTDENVKEKLKKYPQLAYEIRKMIPE